MRIRKILLAIPAFNEEESIASVILKCQEHYPDADLLVINDGSSDRTVEVLNNLGANYISLPYNLGVGGAIRAAFTYAMNENYEFLIQLDADGQHNPAHINLLFEEIDKFDVVIGSRFLSNSDYTIERIRKFGIAVIRKYLGVLTSQQFSDPTSGFRLNNKQAIDFFAKTYPVEYLGDTVGSIVLGCLNELKFGECSTPMAQRQGGRPSQGRLRSLGHLTRTLLTISMMRLRSSGKELN
jgi:glycosyltransferase involved in cell wall biosynthesis